MKLHPKNTEFVTETLGSDLAEAFAYCYDKVTERFINELYVNKYTAHRLAMEFLVKNREFETAATKVINQQLNGAN